VDARATRPIALWRPGCGRRRLLRGARADDPGLDRRRRRPNRRPAARPALGAREVELGAAAHAAPARPWIACGAAGDAVDLTPTLLDCLSRGAAGAGGRARRERAAVAVALER